MASYRVADEAGLPFRNFAFDLVFSVCVLHHIDLGERDHFRAELRRVAKPGGLVLVFEHNSWTR